MTRGHDSSGLAGATSAKTIPNGPSRSRVHQKKCPGRSRGATRYATAATRIQAPTTIETNSQGSKPKRLRSEVCWSSVIRRSFVHLRAVVPPFVDARTFRKPEQVCAISPLFVPTPQTSRSPISPAQARLSTRPFQSVHTGRQQFRSSRAGPLPRSTRSTVRAAKRASKLATRFDSRRPLSKETALPAETLIGPFLVARDIRFA